MIAIIDYGVGNLFSLKSSLRSYRPGGRRHSDDAKIADAERVILPAWAPLRRL